MSKTQTMILSGNLINSIRAAFWPFGSLIGLEELAIELLEWVVAGGSPRPQPRIFDFVHSPYNYNRSWGEDEGPWNREVVLLLFDDDWRPVFVTPTSESRITIFREGKVVIELGVKGSVCRAGLIIQAVPADGTVEVETVDTVGVRRYPLRLPGERFEIYDDLNVPAPTHLTC